MNLLLVCVFVLKLFQLAISGEISASPTPSTIMQDSPMYLSVALQYGRSKQALYVRDTLQAIINDVANQDDLDLVTDPCIVRPVDFSRGTLIQFAPDLPIKD